MSKKNPARMRLFSHQRHFNIYSLFQRINCFFIKDVGKTGRVSCVNQFLIAADVSNNSNIQQPDGSYWICQNHLIGPPPSGSFSARVLRAVNNPCNSGQTSIIRVGNKYSFAPQRAAKLLYEKLKNGTWPTGGQSMLCQLYFSYSHIVSVLLSSTAMGSFISDIVCLGV